MHYMLSIGNKCFYNKKILCYCNGNKQKKATNNYAYIYINFEIFIS